MFVAVFVTMGVATVGVKDHTIDEEHDQEAGYYGYRNPREFIVTAMLVMLLFSLSFMFIFA